MKETIIAFILGLLLGGCLAAMVFDKSVCPSVELKEAQQPDCNLECNFDQVCPRLCENKVKDCVDEIKNMKKQIDIAQQIYDGTVEDLKEVIK